MGPGNAPGPADWRKSVFEPHANRAGLPEQHPDNSAIQGLPPGVLVGLGEAQVVTHEPARDQRSIAQDLLDASEDFRISRQEAVTEQQQPASGFPFELANGLDPLDPSDAAGDLDGDGATNLEEFTAATDPQDPTDFPSCSVVGTVIGVNAIAGGLAASHEILVRTGSLSSYYFFGTTGDIETVQIATNALRGQSPVAVVSGLLAWCPNSGVARDIGTIAAVILR